MLIGSFVSVGAQVPSNSSQLSTYVSQAVDSISSSQIQKYAEILSSFGSRVTGYPGNLEAAKYIASVFKSDGLQVINQSFTTAMPVDTGSWIYADGKNLTVYALWPNGPIPGATPTYVSGPLVYVGDGSLDEMNGKQINGSIVLENFNSGSNWLYAADLGAKAVIFLAPNYTDQLQSLEKSIPAPLYMPRLYANGEVAKELLSAARAGATVMVHDGMKWENVTSYNVIGVVNGTSSRNVVIAAANYDSWSVVPSVAPGGQDSLGIATLLAAAKYFSQHRPYRTLWLAALSGYWEGLVGPYAFVKQDIYSPENLAGTTKIWLVEGISISSGSPAMDALYFGWHSAFSLQYLAVSKYLSYLQPEIAGFIQDAGLSQSLPSGLQRVDFAMYGAGFDWGTQPTFYMLVTEPVTQSGTIGFTLMTSFSRRETWNTPINDLPYTDWSNVMSQVATVVASVAGFADTPDLGISWSADAPQVFTAATIYTFVYGGFGFAKVNIKTVQFDYQTGWYDTVPNMLLQIPARGWSGGPTSSGSGNPLYWPFVNQWFICNEQGTFTYSYAMPYSSITVYAWKINSSDGQLDYSINLGIYGTAQGVSGGFSNTLPYIYSQTLYMLVPVFQGEPITTFDVLDPRSMIPSAVYDNRNPTLALFSEPAVANVYKQETRATPTFYYTDLIPATTVLMAFVQKGERVVLTYNPNPTQTGPLIILDNASSSEPDGFGYTLNGPYEIHDSFYEQAKDMYLLTQERYAKLEEHYATSPAVVKLLTIAGRYLNYARGNLTTENYGAAYNDSMVAWAYASQAYATQLMPMYGQISGTMLFFSFLIIPFGYLFEELVFGFRGFKRILTIFAIIVVVILVFDRINPSLSAVSNSSMAILGVALLIFALFILWVFYGEVSTMFKEGAQKRLGMHSMVGSAGAASMHAASTAVANMRRRPFMTALTLTTIVIFAASNVALTSSTTTLGMVESAVPGTGLPKQNGMLVKWLYGMPNVPSQIMGSAMLNYVKGIGGNKFDYWPTYFYYPTLLYKYTFNGTLFSTRIIVPYQLVGTNKTSISELVFMGVTPGQAEQLFGNGLVSGNFSLGKNDVIISKYVAETIGAKVGNYVDFLGIGKFKVVGILQNNITATGYDGLFATPEDPAYSLAANEGWQTKFTTEHFGEPVPTYYLALINWQTAKELGGFFSYVELIPAANMNESELMSFGSLIRYPLTPSVFVGYDGRSKGLTPTQIYLVLGISVTLVLLIIAALAILNAMYENIQIRKREIYIYSSLGIAPNGAMLMFIGESLIYALIGAVLGFLLGFSLDYFFISYHILPSSFAFNFSSWSMVLSLFFIIVATLAGSYYPSRLSSRMITPSLERKWRPESKARGRSWDFQLPMKLSDEKEAIAVLRYLAEYYNGIGYEKPSFRLEGAAEIDEKSMTVSFKVRLAPYEASLTQRVELKFIKTPAQEYALYATLALLTGDIGLWSARAPIFVADLRTQVILWRGLSPELRKKYMG
jgi:hypothetical protein